MMQVPIFPTPLLVMNFSQHEKYAGKFGNFERVDRKPEPWVTPHNSSFPEIMDDDPYINVEMARAIKSDLLKDIQLFLQELKMPSDIFFSEFWYNAYYEKQGQESHNHLSPTNHNPFWCGIYFAQNCFPGSLFLQRVDTSLRTQQHVEWSQTELAPYYNDTLIPQISDGEIILFPPHLHHSVNVDYRNKTDMRLTFSFNVKLQGYGQEHVY